MVPIWGRSSGMVMTAMIFPPTAGSMKRMSPVVSSYSSSMASLVQPVFIRTAQRGAKSRPLAVPPTKMAEGLYLFARRGEDFGVRLGIVLHALVAVHQYQAVHAAVLHALQLAVREAADDHCQQLVPGAVAQPAQLAAQLQAYVRGPGPVVLDVGPHILIGTFSHFPASLYRPGGAEQPPAAWRRRPPRRPRLSSAPARAASADKSPAPPSRNRGRLCALGPGRLCRSRCRP